jgi:tetratricopeptide (TPR) repeat protein
VVGDWGSYTQSGPLISIQTPRLSRSFKDKRKLTIMADSVALTEFKQGLRMLRDGHPGEALNHFSQAADMEKQNPYYMSFVGVALVRAKRQSAPAVKLCETALGIKRNEVQLYLNMAEVYVSAGRREDAVRILDRAQASLGRDVRIQRARLRLGSRRSPFLPFLDRENVLNRQLGILRHRLLSWSDRSRLFLPSSSLGTDCNS